MLPLTPYLRFADLHRDGSRIVLISGDMDFAADIADFKRRMFLSVILLHRCYHHLRELPKYDFPKRLPQYKLHT